MLEKFWTEIQLYGLKNHTEFLLPHLLLHTDSELSKRMILHVYFIYIDH